MTDDPCDYVAEAITAHWGERCPDYEPQCACCAAWAQYDGLKAALRPFAAEAAEWADSVPDSYHPSQPEPGTRVCNPGSEARFSIGDLRRARALLAVRLLDDPA